jgi:hypothetical protein
MHFISVYIFELMHSLLSLLHWREILMDIVVFGNAYGPKFDAVSGITVGPDVVFGNAYGPKFNIHVTKVRSSITWDLLGAWINIYKINAAI